ncbi:MAG TPA: TIGR03118 family protein [Terriglobia bacterium]|nr:TIGR03118 family protein [Terriglobia bacterium]
MKTFHQRLSHVLMAFALLALMVGLAPRPAAAQDAVTQYAMYGLVSNIAGKAIWTDPNLQNPWGIANSSSGPFWISDQLSGLSSFYNGSGSPFGTITVPGAAGNPLGSPTGIVYNSNSSSFLVTQNGISGSAVFIFDTLDGTISGWSPGVNPSEAVVAVDNSATDAIYTGLAIATNSTGTFIFAADSWNNEVDMYDGNFNLVKHITDPTIPAGFTPFNAQTIKNYVFVTYAAVSGGPGGYVDIFDFSGNFVKRFASGDPLNQPWGVAWAPKNFGPQSGTILIGNNVDSGTINAFDINTGAFKSPLMDLNGKPLIINGLWAIEFGAGGTNNGPTNQLFFTAGPNDAEGFFGVIAPTTK